MPDAKPDLIQRVRLIGKRLAASNGTLIESVPVAGLSDEWPADYRAFLTEFGAGVLGDSSFAIYPTLMRANEVYGNEVQIDLSHLLLIGDDLNGYCLAYDTSRQWKVVEIDKFSRATEVLAASFIDFLEADWRLSHLRERQA